MRRQAWLLLLLSLGASPLRAETSDAGAPMQALIFGGGTTPEAAEAWLARWQQAAKAMQPLVTLAPGFPRVAESASLTGLKPGFHVVVLGFCEAPSEGARNPFAVIRAVFPGTYAKDVQGVRPACPQLPKSPRVPVDSATVRAGAARLTVVHWTLPEVGQGSLALQAFVFDDDHLVGDDAEVLPASGGEGWDEQHQAQLSSSRTTVTAVVGTDFHDWTGGGGDKHQSFRISYGLEAGRLKKVVKGRRR